MPITSERYFKSRNSSSISINNLPLKIARLNFSYVVHYREVKQRYRKCRVLRSLYSVIFRNRHNTEHLDIVIKTAIESNRLVIYQFTLSEQRRKPTSRNIHHNNVELIYTSLPILLCSARCTPPVAYGVVHPKHPRERAK